MPRLMNQSVDAHSRSGRLDGSHVGKGQSGGRGSPISGKMGVAWSTLLLRGQKVKYLSKSIKSINSQSDPRACPLRSRCHFLWRPCDVAVATLALDALEARRTGSV